MSGGRPALLVTGAGALCGAGDGVAAFESALRAGAAARGPVWRADAWDDKKHTGPDRRRLSRLGRMAVTAAGQALEAAGLADGALDPAAAERTGVVIGTGYGNAEDAIAFLAGVAERGAEFANPALFPTSVLNASAAHVSLRFKLTGYGATIAARDVSGELALVQAADALVLDHADRLVVGGAEEALPALAAGLRKLRLAAADAAPAPFAAAGRGALVLGEGAAALVVERADRAGARAARAPVALAGWASAGPPAAGPLGYATDGGAALARAAEEALAAGGVAPADVDLVVTGAAGLRALDALVAAALRRLFGARLAAGEVALAAPRACTGWFPASGAHLAVAAVLAVGRGFVPATSGAAAAARAGVPGLRAVAEERAVRTALVLSAGAGGAVAALLFARV